MGLSIYVIVHFVLGVISIFLGFLVFLKNKSRPTNRIFALLTFSVAFWSICYGIWLMMDNQQSALLWSRLLNLGATFIPVFTLHWILLLLKKRKRNILLFLYFVTFVFALFSFSNFYISGTKSVLQFPYWPQMGWLYVLFLIAGWGGMILYGYLLLIKELKHATGFYKEQIKFVLFGLIVGYLGGSTNYPLMIGLDWFPPIGSPFVIAFPVVFGYAMVRHRLMDIKVVLRKYSVYIISLASIISPALGIKYVVNNYFARTEIWVDFLILISSIALFPALKNYYYRLANKYFFSSLYDDRAVIAALTDKLRSTLEVKRIYKFIADALINSLHAKAFGILTVEEKSGKYAVQYNRGFAVGRQMKFAGDDNLYKHYIKKGKAIVVEELKESSYVKYKRMIDLFNHYGVEILIPLNVKDKTIGLVAIGAKESGDMYNNEDIQFLEIIGAQSAIALENALLFEETKNFGIKLEKEVEKATTDLRAANVQLKKLDQAKSDFVSIASHQLRTPLTVIKGYISMMLEGSFGELGDREQDSLEKVYESNERLIRLVEDLLNISRIESGRLKYVFASLQFSDFVSKIVEELSGYATKRGLRLRLIMPKEKLPFIEIDKEKIRQVVMNLIDNSIKYTKQGTIKVQIEKKAKTIQFCVSDTGLGLRAEEKPICLRNFPGARACFWLIPKARVWVCT